MARAMAALDSIVLVNGADLLYPEGLPFNCGRIWVKETYFYCLREESVASVIFVQVEDEGGNHQTRGIEFLIYSQTEQVAHRRSIAVEVEVEPPRIDASLQRLIELCVVGRSLQASSFAQESQRRIGELLPFLGRPAPQRISSGHDRDLRSTGIRFLQLREPADRGPRPLSTTPRGTSIAASEQVV
jgi:hypothetical protein